jgi:hypothetical protein
MFSGAHAEEVVATVNAAIRKALETKAVREDLPAGGTRFTQVPIIG